ncbi:MAG: branched-chain amino acid ABC transporter substrate-binding protein [Deltaproteobacteria bacterium]|nr:MAG: branched-chain amino acid ABC transporter substrate-binding protein [Deltaproteobacteria bacterium]
MKRFGIFMLLLAFMLGFSSMAAAKTLKIGTLSPLTGPYAQDGTDILQGVKTAVAVFEKAGGIPGYDKIEVVPGDSACDGGKATMAANKLINSGVAGVVGAYCSSATIPASVPLNQANIVQITPASTHTDVTGRGFKQIFRMPPRDDVQAWSTVKFLEDGLKIKTLALIDDRQTYTVGLTENITEFAKEKNKIKIVALEHITPGDKDFTAVLTKLKRINPDVIYMGVYQPEGSLMVRQAKALGLKSKLLSEDAVFHPKFLEVGGKAAEGTYLTFAKAPETKERKEFEKTYKNMWKAKTVGSYGYYAYDAGMILLETIKKAGTKTNKMVDTLRNTTWSGVTGEIKFDYKGDRKLAHVIWIVKDGKFVPYWDPLTESYF